MPVGAEEGQLRGSALSRSTDDAHRLGRGSVNSRMLLIGQPWCRIRFQQDDTCASVCPSFTLALVRRLIGYSGGPPFAVQPTPTPLLETAIQCNQGSE